MENKEKSVKIEGEKKVYKPICPSRENWIRGGVRKPIVSSKEK